VTDGTMMQVHGFIPELKIGRHYLDYNGAAALESLRRKFGLVIYFRGNELYVGAEAEKSRGLVRYQTNLNVEDAGALRWREEKDGLVRVEVLAIDTQTGYVSNEIHAGPVDAEQLVRITVYDQPFDTAVAIAEAKVKLLNYKGYDGYITTLGSPVVQHGYTARFVDPNFPERSGDYVVTGVTTRFGSGGFKRDVYLGAGVNNEGA
jgi:hypothetical protein